MRRAVGLLSLLVAALVWPVAPANAGHLTGKSFILVGGAGRAHGDIPWQVLKEQLKLRGVQDSSILEFQYAGGDFTPDGSWHPYSGGACEGYSRASMLALRALVGGLASARPDHEVMLVGWDTGGFVVVQALLLAASGADPAGGWDNVSGAAAISAPVAGLSGRRAAFYHAAAAAQGCADTSMIQWIEDVAKEPDRYAAMEAKAALVQQAGYKIGTFGNTVDCAFKYISADVCPKIRGAAPGGPATAELLLRALDDERPTQFIKNALWREFNITMDVDGELADNHRATLLSTQPMAELADLVVSQSR
ncbi:MAG: hypothetical protein U0821_16775 [Chloroflexota bacterium]